MKETLDKINLICFHCGEECTDDQIKSEEKVFCCTGCKTVYEILNENALCDYYSLENSPGHKINESTKGEFAFLDEDKIKTSLLNFQEGGTSIITLYIPAIHCSSCIWLLENLHKIHPGVITSAIHFQKKELDIQFNEEISLRQLAELLASLGYAPQITLNGKKVTNKSINKSLYYKLGVAGFCFGNIMLLSIPDYLDFFGEFNGTFKSFFSYLNLILALPVFFYSASDYFTASYNSLKNRVINIDLPIAIALLAAFGQSVYEILSGTGTGYMDSLSGLIFFLLVGKWYQNKTYQALSFERDYKSYFPLAATVIKDNQKQYISLNELKSGDIILVRNEEIIPADGIIIDGEGSIDYSFVTGESVPISKRKRDQVFAGGKQKGIAIQIKITRAVSESYLTQLWNKENNTKDISGLSQFTNKVGKVFTIAVIIISLATYLFWVGKDSSVALYATISVLIIFCPCTLSLSIPFCFGNAMNFLGKNGFYLKNTETIERLADTATIVFDKTGTLTYAAETEIEFEGFLTSEEKSFVKSLVWNSTHPLSRSLAALLENEKIVQPDSYLEYPSKGVSGTFKGVDVKVGSADFVEISKTHIPPKTNTTRVFISIGGTIKGNYKFKNKYREGIKSVLKTLDKRYSIHLLSGDNSGEEATLSKFFKKDHMRFNQKPTDKLSYIINSEKQHKTMMIGDGLNDAGALMNSNCGISVTENNGVFSPACDAILEANKLNKLPDFLSFSKASLKTVQFSLGISLLYNIIGLFFATQGLFKPMVAAILMPLSSVSMVLFVTITTNILAKKHKLK